MKLFQTKIFLLLFFIFISTAASYSITVTIEAPGATNTTAKFDYVGSEIFDSRSTAAFTTDFGWGPNGLISASYTGGNIVNADRDGGAGGTGRYEQSFPGNPLNIAFSQKTGSKGITYFGFWASGYDVNNRINFYYQGTSIYNWTSADGMAAVGGNRAYRGCSCSNIIDPNSLNFFVNFFFNDIQIDRVQMWQYPAGGAWESDNHTVGYFTQQSGGYTKTYTTTTTITTAPTTTASYNMTVTIEAPGVVQTNTKFGTFGVEPFDSRTSSTFDTDFGNSIIKGRYTGGDVYFADANGGAGGTGKYSVAWNNNPVTLTITQVGSNGITYFGFWLSSMDNANKIDFSYKGTTIVTFTAVDVMNALAGRKEYFGNVFKNVNYQFIYVFINIYFNNFKVDTIRIWEDGTTGGYETDNHTVGDFTVKSGEAIVVANRNCRWCCNK